MRYAIISDLHGNRQAVNSVFTDIEAVGVDGIICLGDVVGYGPAPADVLQKVHAKVDHIVLGNHDAVIGERLTADLFNPQARQIIEWTRDRLGDEAKRFFAKLPAVIEGEGFRCAHAEFAMPLRYGYILEPEDAQASWQTFDEPLAFVGHSHEPGIFLTGRSGKAYLLDAQDFQIEVGKRYLVNVGSVGQPRDGDVRACYCLYDTDEKSVYFRRIAFDVDSYREELERHELPAEPSYFLAVAESHERKPIRETLDFRPLSNEEAARQGEAGVARLRQAESRARRWMMLGIVLAVLACGALGAAALAYYQLRPDAILVEGAVAVPPKPLRASSTDQSLPLAPGTVQAVTPDAPLPGWDVTLDRSGRVKVASAEFAQRVDTNGGTGERYAGFVVASEEAVPFEIRSAGFLVEAGMRFAAQGRFRTRAWDGGYVEMALVLRDDNGAEQVLLTKAPPGIEEVDGWGRLSSRTMPSLDVLDRPGTLQYVLRGQFVGTVEIADCRLVVKEWSGGARSGETP